jgi:uncharacterized protein YuzE
MNSWQKPLRITHDPSVNAAYIYLAEEILPGGVARTVSVDPIDVRGIVNLDLDEDGRIIGIEVLDGRGLGHLLHAAFQDRTASLAEPRWRAEGCGEEEVVGRPQLGADPDPPPGRRRPTS